MNDTIKKAFRTAQSELPVLKEAKDSFYFHMRRLLFMVHDRDFMALKTIARWPRTGLCIDVGANQGQSIESILQVRPDAMIVSFEANPNLARMLDARYVNNPNVSIEANGLSDSPGTFTLFVPSYKGFVYDGLASFSRASAASWLEHRVFGYAPSRLSISEVKCEVNTLDMHHLAPIFMKIDVQGHEFQVLNGGRQTLREYEPVLLIESFNGDSRTVRLAEELNYEEYCFDGSCLCKGSPNRGSNSFLMTPERAKWLFA
jgi:FkbM family methyltransferase